MSHTCFELPVPCGNNEHVNVHYWLKALLSRLLFFFQSPACKVTFLWLIYFSDCCLSSRVFTSFSLTRVTLLIGNHRFDWLCSIIWDDLQHRELVWATRAWKTRERLEANHSVLTWGCCQRWWWSRSPAASWVSWVWGFVGSAAARPAAAAAALESWRLMPGRFAGHSAGPPQTPPLGSDGQNIHISFRKKRMRF